MTTLPRIIRRAARVAALTSFAIASAGAQGVVIAGSSSAQYIELRPLTLDSVRVAETDSAWGSYRQTSTGILARCVASAPYCTFFRSGSRQGLTAMMQDLDVTAWGLGQGVSVHAQLRARSAMGDGRGLWPQAQQHFDALAAYIDVDRSLGRLRVGRQWVTSSLGVFNFDGAGIQLHGGRFITAQAYGGNALVEGLNRELSADALAPVEDIPPPDRAYLFGGIVQLRPWTASAFSVQYQREVRHDHASLYSERVGASASIGLGVATFDAQLARDLATRQNNELSASLRGPLARIFDATVTARHYVPYFDLWTIWGAFSPIAYNEIGGDLRYTTPGGRLTLDASGAKRAYDDAGTGVATLPLRRDGWRLGGQASARVNSTLTADAAYHADIGFGASGTDADAALRWMRSDRLTLALRGVAFQTIDEFQVGEGRVYGLGGEGSWQLTPLVRVVGDGFLYRHNAHERPDLVDWNQRRASLRLEWSLGSEPTWGGAIGRARTETP